MSIKSNIKIRMWQFAFICLSKTLRPFFSFFTTLGQQREIMFHVARIAVLVEKEFDFKDSILTSQNFRNVVLGNVQEASLVGISKQILKSTRRIKEITSNNDSYDEFLENIIKTWETHKVRDLKEYKTKISVNNALKCSEKRGGFYFLALIFALQPKNLDVLHERVVYLIGAWIQIVDDYADRKKDKNHKNTPFTIHQECSLKKIFKQYKMDYKKQIQSSVNLPSLIILLEIFSFLWPIMP